jgi:hypothetical protein
MRVTLDAAGTANGIRDLMRSKKTEVVEAAGRTLNILAMRSVREIQAEMGRVFDRPTRYALNSVKWAENLPGPSAEVQWRGSEAFGETARQGYLRAQIYGGPRSQKASEIRLQRMRVGGQMIFIVPTQFAELDGYGNVTRGQMVKILSSLDALGGPGQGFDGNRRRDGRSRGRRRREEYFAIWPGTNDARRLPGGRLLPNNLAPGIYRRFGEGAREYARPILIFAKKAPVYRQRLDPEAIVARTVQRDLPAVWAERLTKALTRSART